MDFRLGTTFRLSTIARATDARRFSRRTKELRATYATATATFTSTRAADASLTSLITEWLPNGESKRMKRRVLK